MERELKNNIKMYYRTYDVILHEQKRISIMKYNEEWTLNDFVKENIQSNDYYEISILHNDREIEVIDSIIINSKVMFKVDVIDIVMKDLINEYGNEKIVIYVNEENSVGFTGGTLGFLAQVASMFVVH